MLAVLFPGMYAAAMNGTAVTATKRCPQRYYCPGGVPQAVFDPANPAALSAADPSIKACPDGTYTQGLQAASVEECCECRLDCAGVELMQKSVTIQL